MSVIEKIASLARKPRPIEIPTPPAPTARVQQLTDRMQAIRADLDRAEGEVRAAEAAERQAGALAVELAEKASAGKLKDANTLAQALRAHREAGERLEAAKAPIESLRTAKAELEPKIEKATADAAIDRYQNAVIAYAAACVPLLALGQAVRDAAPHAGIPITAHNSPGLIGRKLQIAGALVDLPSQVTMVRVGRDESNQETRRNG